MRLIEKIFVTKQKKLEDEVNKSRIVPERAKLTWLDHMQSVIYRSYNHNITIAFFLRHKLRQTYRCKYEYNLIKNLPTHLKD